MSLPIALQLYTVRDVLEKDLDAGLAQIAAMGYQNVELAGLYGHTAEAFKALLDQHGLTAVSVHEGIEHFFGDTQPLIDRAKLFGYQYVNCPYLSEEHRKIGYGKITEQVLAVAETLSAHGLTVCYHNHDFEWDADAVEPGKRGVDLLFDGTRLNSELDVYWVKKAGDEPLDWMKKLSGRLPILHMKDMADTPEQGFAEVGTGTIDFAAILDAAPGCGVKYLVVEQDSNWAVSPMDSARVGLENLSGMLV